jgi:hypothetical protein
VCRSVKQSAHLGATMSKRSDEEFGAIIAFLLLLALIVLAAVVYAVCLLSVHLTIILYSLFES